MPLKYLRNTRYLPVKVTPWRNIDLDKVPPIDLEKDSYEVTLAANLPHTKGFIGNIKLADFRRRDSYLILPQVETKLVRFLEAYVKEV